MRDRDQDRGGWSGDAITDCSNGGDEEEEDGEEDEEEGVTKKRTISE